MLEFLQNLFTDSSFIPHGHCYLWKPSLVWLNIISDSLIALVYYSIPIILIYFVHKRKDFPFKWILLLFGAFIVSCGTTHVMDVWTLWHPTYWLSTFIKFITAIVSLYTAIALLPIIPQALALPSPAQLEAANCQLKLTLKELENTQSQLIQTEKMSSLGQLVAGIAHEINNPVNFIYGNISHAREYTKDLLDLVELYQQSYCPPTPEIHEQLYTIDLDFLQHDLPKVLDSMKMGAERIRQIVLSLRNFSRLDEDGMKAVDIHEGMDSTLLLLQNRLKAKSGHPEIQVIRDYGNLPPIVCHAGQMNQVFMNLLTNAIDVLEESFVISHLSLVNKTEQRTNDQGQMTFPQIRIRTLIEEERVIISIADNGLGMTEEVGKRLFDPFFTTKPVGKGTGMGLSISYQIVVKKHCGQIQCISAPGEGAEFIIMIPLHEQSST
ncbi:MAG: sensor histidine kinase [Nostoc sp.]